MNQYLIVFLSNWNLNCFVEGLVLFNWTTVAEIHTHQIHAKWGLPIHYESNNTLTFLLLIEKENRCICIISYLPVHLLVLLFFLYIQPITISCRAFFSISYSIALLQTDSPKFIYMKMYLFGLFLRIVFAGYKYLDWLLFELFQHVLLVPSCFCCFWRKVSH